MSGIDKATLALVIDTLNRIGKNSDPAGAATLFAQLSRLYTAVDQVEGYTDTLETLLGLTGDVANGNGNIMQRLAQLIAYTDTLETTVNAIKPKTDSIGTNADAAGLNTLFALLKKLDAKAGGVDPFAMAKNIANYYVSVPIIAAGAIYDIATINGKGIVNQLQISFERTEFSLFLVIDGIEYPLSVLNGTQPAAPFTAGKTNISSSAGSYITELTGPIAFNTSITVRIKNTSGAATASAYNAGLRVNAMMS